MIRKKKKQKRKWYLDKYTDFDFDSIDDEEFESMLPKLKSYVAIRLVIFGLLFIALVIVFLESF